MSTNALARIEQPAEVVLLAKADELQVYTSALERRLVQNGGIAPLMEHGEHQGKTMLRVLLGYTFKDLGMKAAPVEYDWDRMWTYIETNHPKFTASDVKSAFEMFLAGRFTDALRDGHDHYQQFSVAFYAPIFRLYAKAQNDARYAVRHKVSKAQLLLQAPSTPREVSEFRSLSIIRGQVDAYLKNGNAHVMAIGFTHDWLVRLGVCKVCEPPTSDELKEALERLRDKKGRSAVAFQWNLQRILAGEKVNDVEWDATVRKRTRSMFADIAAKGQEALAIVDAELARLKAVAKGNGHDVDATETVAA